MRNSLVVISCLIVFAFLGFTHSAFAISQVSSAMVDADGSYTVQPGTPPTYTWTEQPWLSLKLPSSAFAYSVSWWTPEGATSSFSNLEITSGTSSVWHSLSDWFAPGGSRKAGDWTVRADYSSAGGADSETFKFKVNAVPEPVSSALFLVGGVALAVRQYRKRKNAGVNS